MSAITANLLGMEFRDVIRKSARTGAIDKKKMDEIKEQGALATLRYAEYNGSPYIIKNLQVAVGIVESLVSIALRNEVLESGLEPEGYQEYIDACLLSLLQNPFEKMISKAESLVCDALLLSSPREIKPFFLKDYLKILGKWTEVQEVTETISILLENTDKDTQDFVKTNITSQLIPHNYKTELIERAIRSFFFAFLAGLPKPLLSGNDILFFLLDFFRNGEKQNHNPIPNHLETENWVEEKYQGRLHLDRIIDYIEQARTELLRIRNDRGYIKTILRDAEHGRSPTESSSFRRLFYFPDETIEQDHHGTPAWENAFANPYATIHEQFLRLATDCKKFNDLDQHINHQISSGRTPNWERVDTMIMLEAPIHWYTRFKAWRALDQCKRLYATWEGGAPVILNDDLWNDLEKRLATEQ